MTLRKYIIRVVLILIFTSVVALILGFFAVPRFIPDAGSQIRMQLLAVLPAVSVLMVLGIAIGFRRRGWWVFLLEAGMVAFILKDAFMRPTFIEYLAHPSFPGITAWVCSLALGIIMGWIIGKRSKDGLFSLQSS